METLFILVNHCICSIFPTNYFSFERMELIQQVYQQFMARIHG